MFLTLDMVVESREIVEAWLRNPVEEPPVEHMEIICQWTREWDHAWESINNLLEEEKAAAMRRKIREAL